MLDADYIPSLCSVQNIALLVLVSIILGPLSLPALIAAGPSVHRNLANAPRKRKPHVRYPLRALFSRLWRLNPCSARSVLKMRCRNKDRRCR